MESKLDIFGKNFDDDFIEFVLQGRDIKEIDKEELMVYKSYYELMLEEVTEEYNESDERTNEYEALIEKIKNVQKTINDSLGLINTGNLEVGKKDYVVYRINSDIYDLFMESKSINDKFKEELKDYKDKELNEYEMESFINLVFNNLVTYKQKQYRINQNIINNFAKSPKGIKLKELLQDKIGENVLSNDDIKYIRKELNEFLLERDHIIEENYAESNVLDEEEKVESEASESKEEEPVKEETPEEAKEEKAPSETSDNDSNSDSDNTPNEEEKMELDSDLVEKVEPVIVPRPKQKRKKENKPASATTTPEENKEPTKEEKSTPPLVPNSINYYTKEGKLPSNIDEARYSIICKELGIPAENGDYILNNDELSRLINDSEVIIASNNEKVTKKYQKKVKEREELLNKFNNILKATETANFSANFKQNIIKNIRRLEDEKTQYESIVSSIEHDTAGDYFYFEDGKFTSDIKGLVVGVGDKKLSKFNKKLREEYLNFDKLSKEQQELVSSRMKERNKNKIEKSKARIAKLQKKTARISRKQIKIVNKNTEKYISKINRKYNNHFANYEFAHERASEILDMENNIKHISEEIQNLENDRMAITGKSLKDKMLKSSLSRDKKKFEAAIKRLRSKQGRCDADYQIYQSIARVR